MSHLRACHCCGSIHRVPNLTPDLLARCLRCGAVVLRGDVRRATARTAAAASAALFLFWPAVLLPILEVERLGHRHASGILMGTLDLLWHGEWLVGAIVLIFSVFFPFVKIVLLLELSLLSLLRRKHKSITYRVMEYVGKWSMMDVLLLAFLVMLIKLGTLVQFRFGPAVLAFVLCVVMSMVASASFDPHAIWEDED